MVVVVLFLSLDFGWDLEEEMQQPNLRMPEDAINECRQA